MRLMRQSPAIRLPGRASKSCCAIPDFTHCSTIAWHIGCGSAAAVVLKEVPDGATMVGNPARQVGRRSVTDESPPAFEPYGITGEIPDPIARALNALLDEVSALRARLGEVEREREETAATEAAAPSPDPVQRRTARARP